MFKKNPQRRRRIMEVTGWKTVFDGTLNLKVDRSVFERWKDMRPVWHERPEDVKHPNSWIPRQRGGYYYYRATAAARGRSQEVLVRRFGNPSGKRFVELVAPIQLRDHFAISDGDEVTVTVEE